MTRLTLYVVSEIVLVWSLLTVASSLSSILPSFLVRIVVHTTCLKVRVRETGGGLLSLAIASGTYTACAQYPSDVVTNSVDLIITLLRDRLLPILINVRQCTTIYRYIVYIGKPGSFPQRKKGRNEILWLALELELRSVSKNVEKIPQTSNNEPWTAFAFA